MRGQRAPAGTITQWIVQQSNKKGFVRVRNFIKVDQSPDTPARVREAILRGERHYRGWMPVARWQWLMAHGTIPPQSEVIHKRPPAEVQPGGLPRYVHGPRLPEENEPTGVYGPVDISVDDIENLLLVAKGDVNQKICLTSGSIRKHRMRRRVAVVKSNQQRGRIAAAGDIRPDYWYPVAADSQLVLMKPRRTRKAVVAEFGQGESGIIPMRGEALGVHPYDGWRREIPGEEIADEIPESSEGREPLPLADEIGNLADAA